MKDLEKRFHRAVPDVYEQAQEECRVQRRQVPPDGHGQRRLQTGKALINARNASAGYMALWERKRLDLTVEAVVLKEEWKPLFSERERKLAEARLRAYGWSPK